MKNKKRGLWHDGGRVGSTAQENCAIKGEMMDVEMKFLRCRWQSLHRRMEQYNVNLFTLNTLLGFRLGDLSPVCPVELKAQSQCTCHNQQGDISKGKYIFFTFSV